MVNSAYCRTMRSTWAALLLCFCLVAHAESLKRPKGVGRPFGSHRRGPTHFDPRHLVESTSNGFLWEEPITMCEEKFRNTTLDHFAWDSEGGTMTYEQRYFICDRFWKKGADGKRGPIFAYIGNEADVELYLNATGLMWESAPEFGALVLFMEHRYYGKSQPFGKDYANHYGYLTTEQTIADYVEILYALKDEYSAHDSAVIGFGGSLGGMYAAWMRMKYPHVLDGAIAASAPIWTFMGEVPPYTPNGFARVVTQDCKPESGASKGCLPNLRKTWWTLMEIGETPEGRASILDTMGFCKDIVLEDASSVWNIIEWVKSAVDQMAEGSYSFPSGYMIGGHGLLPAFPLRKACTHLAEPLDGLELLKAVSSAVDVFYNYTSKLECNDFRHAVNPGQQIVYQNWNHQYCTEIFQIWATDGVTDMFWEDPWDPEGSMKWCKSSKGVVTRPYWATHQWGGKNITTASNIFFSNGEFDPWSAGGVLEDINESVVSMIVKEGGHHEDLMFSHKDDSQSVRDVRNCEKQHMKKWIDEKAGLLPSNPLTGPLLTTPCNKSPTSQNRVVIT